MTQRICVCRLVVVIVVVISLASPARADIHQWEYIDPADPSQGKQQSTTLAPDGAGVDAVPGANLNFLNLTRAYLIGADLTDSFGRLSNLTNADLSQANLTSAFLNGATLTGADLSQANLTDASFAATTLTGTDFTGAEVRGADFAMRGRCPLLCGGTGIALAQLYSTASFRSYDLSGISLWSNDLTGSNFAGQNLTNASFWAATLSDADFTDAKVRGANFDKAVSYDDWCIGCDPIVSGTGITLAQLYSTASYQASDLRGIGLSLNDLTGGNLTGQNLANANFGGATLNGADFSAADARGAVLDPADVITTNLVLPNGHINGLQLEADGLLVVRHYQRIHPRYQYEIPSIPITIDQHLMMAPGGTLRMVFEADAWDSTISFAPGIPVALGGTLELTFADDVNLAGQVGRTLDLFDWTGVTPTGAFTIASPYMWDTSNLYTTGQVTLTAVPEPSSLAAWLIAGIGWRRWRRPGNRAISRRVRRLVLSIVLAGCSLAGTSKALAAFNVIEATIPEMQAAMESGATTSEGLVNEYLRRIALYDDAGPTLNSVLALNPLALESAQSLDEERLATGPRGPLHGIPILLKDNIDTFDQPTTGGALIFADSVPPDDAFLTQKLRDAGAVVLGKANLTELGNLVSYNMPNGFSVVGGQTLNPYGPGSITPSGSSSGSAVSVAANLVAAAVGTETQGSIVGPAAYNSVVGIRPTVGLISRDGIIPGAHTQDTPGPLARTVTDAAIMLGAMIGVDTNDPKTLESVGHTPANYTQFLNPNGLAGKRLGFVRDPRVFTIDPTEVQLAEAAIDALEQVGATVVDHINFSANVIDVFNLWGPPELPKVFTHEFVPGFESYLASLGENAPANTLAEFVAFNAAHAAQAIPYGQGVLQDALATGGDLNDPGYIAQRDEAIRLIGRDGIDAILDSDDLDALVFPYEWPAIAAVPGYPAIQVPAGFNVNGVPFSVGFVGKPFTEPELIEIAYSFEQATQLRRPPVFLSGDFNHDGSVDAADYVVWRKGLGTTYTQDDYNDWAANFGSTLGSGSSQLAALPLSPAIPEPTSALLLLSFAAIGVWRHRCGFHRPKFTAVKQAVNLRTLGGP